MDLRKKIKNFFTLTRKANAGFTLVELIVVIAILAILGGVAVPAYSGYVKKAERSADEALLNELNTAFASACMANGESNINREDNPKINITDKTIDAVNPLLNTSADIQESFKKFFEGEGEAFKVFTKLFYDPVLGMFSVDEVLSFAYGNGTVTFSASDIASLNDSTFMSKLGVDGLLNKVDFVANFASALDSSESYNKVLNDADFQKTMLGYLGYTADEIAEMEAENAVFDVFDQEIRDMSGMDQDKYNKIKANMTVLYAAKGSTTQSTDAINNLLNSSDPKQTLISAVNNNASDGIAQAALYYGMYTAYAQHTGDTTKIQNTENPVGLLLALDDEEIAGFKEYVASAQGQKDLKAYQSSMNMITDSTTSTEAVRDLLVNGFNNEELNSVIKNATGK